MIRYKRSQVQPQSADGTPTGSTNRGKSLAELEVYSQFVKEETDLATKADHENEYQGRECRSDFVEQNMETKAGKNRYLWCFILQQ